MHESYHDRIAREAYEADQRARRRQEEWTRQIREQEAREREAREYHRNQRSGGSIPQAPSTDIPTPLAVLLLLVIGFLIYACRHQANAQIQTNRAPVPHERRNGRQKRSAKASRSNTVRRGERPIDRFY